MNLQMVTITGADDSTDVGTLIELSKQYPFVEWGILISRSSAGRHRFPSPKWIHEFAAWAEIEGVNFCSHMCGQWVRETLVGRCDPANLPDCIYGCQRIQINTHAEQLPSTLAMVENLNAFNRNHRFNGIRDDTKSKQFIFQFDNVNNHLAYAMHGYGFDVAALFDTSGGAGITPESWPDVESSFPCGYAGGLSDANVREALDQIEQVCDNRPYWIDMERRVRTSDDSALDMDKVERVLALCDEFMMTNV